MQRKHIFRETLIAEKVKESEGYRICGHTGTQQIA